jgi:hypothetical protein
VDAFERDVGVYRTDRVMLEGERRRGVKRSLLLFFYPLILSSSKQERLLVIGFPGINVWD